jgi:hypothetical protein
MNKLLVLGLVFAMMLSIGIAISCGDDDDDSSDDTTAGDDDTSPVAPTCQSVFEAFDACSLQFLDDNGDPIAIADVIATCESDDPGDYALTGSIAACIITDEADCDAMSDCINAIING